MANPAARIGDTHICPKVTPGTPPVPHVGGLIIGPGCPTVLIEGQPAATMGDPCICVGEPDMIVAGSSGVYIGGKPAARMGDRTAHGGKVTSGCGTVLIGEVMGRNFLGKPSLFDENEDHQEPSREEKIRIIKQAIEDCITMLEKKLELLELNDAWTMLNFKKWFGEVNENKKGIIKERIKKQLDLCKILILENFTRIPYEIHYRNWFAYVYSTDDSFTIYLGNPFWNKAGKRGKDSNAWTLIHEMSHFKSVGKTKDYAYDEECESLAIDNPKRALYNADSFAFFITR